MATSPSVSARRDRDPVAGDRAHSTRLGQGRLHRITAHAAQLSRGKKRLRREDRLPPRPVNADAVGARIRRDGDRDVAAARGAVRRHGVPSAADAGADAAAAIAACVAVAAGGPDPRIAGRSRRITSRPADKTLLPAAAAALGLRVPPFAVCDGADEIAAFAATQGWPVVVKRRARLRGARRRDLRRSQRRRSRTGDVCRADANATSSNPTAGAGTLSGQAHLPGRTQYFQAAAWQRTTAWPDRPAKR